MYVKLFNASTQLLQPIHEKLKFSYRRLRAIYMIKINTRLIRSEGYSLLAFRTVCTRRVNKEFESVAQWRNGFPT